MAEEFQVGGSGNWWDTARNRIESGASPSSTTLTSIVSFGWPTEIVDNKAKSTMDSVSVSGPAPSIVFQDSLKLQASDSSSATAPGVLADPRLQIMGLALSSQGMDWNQALLRNEKAESSFGSTLQEDMSTNASFQQQEAAMGSAQDQWRHKLYSPGSSGDPSIVNEYKQMNRGFSLDQPQFNSQISSSDSTVKCQGYQMDSAVYASASTVLQGILASDNQSQLSNFDNRTVNYQYPSNYGLNSGEIMPSWTKFPQFLGNSPPKQPAPNSQLHFSNNTPFWNASAAGLNDVRSTFLPSLQPQFPSASSFNEKPSKNTSEVRDLGTVAKKSSSEPSTKRPRNETPSPLPAFKVRKEKMGDRITALQQLVSPFGKTDTASVLSETTEYIKFLHEQVKVLSTPYMKSGAALQHQQQNSGKSKDGEGPNQDLRSRGLCLVPVSSTFPVTHETTVDFWNPTFGGTFR